VGSFSAAGLIIHCSIRAQANGRSTRVVSFAFFLSGPSIRDSAALTFDVKAMGVPKDSGICKLLNHIAISSPAGLWQKSHRVTNVSPLTLCPNTDVLRWEHATGRCAPPSRRHYVEQLGSGRLSGPVGRLTQTTARSGAMDLVEGTGANSSVIAHLSLVSMTRPTGSIPRSPIDPANPGD
jgi:hypothetical protein